MRAWALLASLAAGCGSTTGGGSDGSVTSADLAVAAPVVRLRDLSATNDPGGSGLIDLQLVVDDTAYPTRTIASIERLSLVWPAGSADAAFHCTEAPWVVPAETTGVLDVQLGVGGPMTLVFASCGVPNTQPPLDAGPMMEPVVDSILFEVDGTLDDATTFKAESAATLQ